MDNTTKSQQLHQALFTFAYVIFIFKYILETTTLIKSPKFLDPLLIVTFLTCIGVKLLMQTYSKIGLLIMIVIGVICAYSSLKMDYFSLFYSYLCVIALQYVDLQKILKVSGFTIFAVITYHVVMYIIYFYTDPSVINIIYRNGIRRHYFFLGHPNTFTAYLAWAILAIIYVYYKQIRFWHLIGFWLMSIIFYQFTNSNTGTLILTGVIIAILAEKRKWKHIDAVLIYLSRYGFIIFSAFFYMIITIYTKLNASLLDMWNELDHALTGRLLFGAYAYDNHGLSIIGRQIPFPKKSYWRGLWLDTIIFDNSYIALFIIFGILYLVLIAVAFHWLGKKTTNIEKILISAYIFYGIMEAYVLNVIICFPLLFIGKYIYEQKKKSKLNEDIVEVALWKQR